MSRQTTLCAVTLAASLILAGCSSSSGDDTSADPSDGYPVALTGALGDATIDSAPVRVLPLSATDADFVLAVGVEPIAIPKLAQSDSATGGTGVYPWQQGLYAAGTPTFAATKDAKIEQIAMLSPDLLVATTFWGLTEQTYSPLSSVAPILYFDTATNADPWQNYQRKVGTALNRESEADAAIAKAENAITAARTDNPALEGKTFNAVISPDEEGVYVLCSDEDNMARTMGDLGLTLSDYAKTVECDGGKGQVSWENVPLLDADVLWVIPDTAEGAAVLDAQPLWGQIPAVRRGAVVTVPKSQGVPFALAFPSPLSLTWAVGEIAPKLAVAAAL